MTRSGPSATSPSGWSGLTASYIAWTRGSFPGFAGELQKHLGVKQYMPPSYLLASALLGRPIILSFWDHVSKAEVVNIREARLLHSMLSEDWEQADRAFVRATYIRPWSPSEPATYSIAGASTEASRRR